MVEQGKGADDKGAKARARKPHARPAGHFSSSSARPRPVTRIPQQGGAPAARKPGAAATPLTPFSASGEGHSAVGFGSGQVRSAVGPDPAEDAPRPIGVDPAETGAFTMLSADEGAVIPTRDTASAAADAARESLRGASSDSVRLSSRRRPVIDRPKESRPKDKRIIAALGLAALVVIVIGFVLIRNAAESTTAVTQGSYDQQAAVTVGSSVSYGDYTFSLAQPDGSTWALVRSGSSSETAAAATAAPTTSQASGTSVSLVQLTGTPVSLVLYNGTFYIGENLDGSWDVICYVMGDGSVSSQLMGSDNNPVGGSGSLSSCTLDGSRLALTDSEGKVTTINLD